MLITSRPSLTKQLLFGQALASGAQTAPGFASDEPTQLMIESSLSNLSQDGQDAVSALMGSFGNVISSLQLIINNSGVRPT